MPFDTIPGMSLRNDLSHPVGHPMKRTSILAAIFACSFLVFAYQSSMAGEPQRCPVCGGYHGAQNGHGYYQGGYGPGSYGAGGYGTSGYGYGSYGLPQGRRYYNGRYFGNLNNRYYGPQYGYF